MPTGTTLANTHSHYMLTLNCNDSASIWTLKVSPIRGKIAVRWFNTPLTEYTFKNVSRRAILRYTWQNITCRPMRQTPGEFVNTNAWQ